MCREESVQEGFLVDTAETPRVLEFLEKLEIANPRWVLTTHKHADHSGANQDLREKFEGL